MDAFIGQHLGDGADQGIGIARGQGKQQLGQPPVGLDGAEDLLVLHLPGHNGLGDAGGPEGLDEPGQLSQREPVHGSGTVLLDLGDGLLLDGGYHDLVAGSAGGLQYQQRELAIAGDETEFGHGMRQFPCAQISA